MPAQQIAHLYFKPEFNIRVLEALRTRELDLEFNPQPWQHDANLVTLALPPDKAELLYRQPRASLTGEGNPQQPVRSTGMMRGELTALVGKNPHTPVSYKVEFFDPRLAIPLAYATAFNRGSIKDSYATQGIDVEKLPFMQYNLGDDITAAIRGSFQTYHVFASMPRFELFSKQGLLLRVNDDVFHARPRPQPAQE